MKAIRRRELTEHEQACNMIRSIISSLRLSRIQDEDVEIARMRLERWLLDNDGLKTEKES